MVIRPETHADRPAVHGLNSAAVGRPDEARLVDALRERAKPLVSLVAEEDGAVVGHILFSPVTLEGCAELMMGLAPMAVAPAR
jgi:putative acetyltransferase